MALGLIWVDNLWVLISTLVGIQLNYFNAVSVHNQKTCYDEEGNEIDCIQQLREEIKQEIEAEEVETGGNNESWFTYLEFMTMGYYLNNHIEILDSQDLNSKLYIYSTYKQGRWGDNKLEKPGWWEIEGNYKWSAWNDRRGSAREIMQEEFMIMMRYLGAIRMVPEGYCLEMEICLADGTANPAKGGLYGPE